MLFNAIVLKLEKVTTHNGQPKGNCSGRIGHSGTFHIIKTDEYSVFVFLVKGFNILKSSSILRIEKEDNEIKVVTRNSVYIFTMREGAKMA